MLDSLVRGLLGEEEDMCGGEYCSREKRNTLNYLQSLYTAILQISYMKEPFNILS